MISLTLVLSIITLLALIMEIAATALKLTGLDIHTARFQALSALTGTGFTTKETELIMGHRQRRGVIMALMIIGPICFLGMFSSILLSIKEDFVVATLLIVLGFVCVLLLLTRSRHFVSFFHHFIEKQLKRHRYPRRVQMEEVLQLSGEYGIYELKITEHSRYANKSLQETDFKDHGFVVLAFERGKDLFAAPKGGDIILAEDVLVLFGHAKHLKQLSSCEK